MNLLTESGYKNIDDCKIGDKVKYFDLVTGKVAYNNILAIEKMTAKNFPPFEQTVTEEVLDEETGELVQKPVMVPQYIPSKKEFIEVEKKETITPDTKWYTVNGKYTFFAMQSIWANMNVTHACLLKIGDVIYDDNDGDVVVESVESFEDENLVWYHLEISGDSSYIADGITLHNASRYWVGGTGNWSDNTNHWSASSGGAGGASKPTSADNVEFDTSSSTAEAAYTMTVDETAYCLDFIMDGPSATDATKVTWAGSSNMYISGSINLVGGSAGITRTYGATPYMIATSGTKTITSNGHSWLYFRMNGSGGTFQLADDMLVANIGVTAGTFDSNGKTVTGTPGGMTIASQMSFYNLTMNGGVSKTITMKFQGDCEVTNNLVINGNSATNRILVYSGTIGTPRTITAATVTVTNADFKDIVGAGEGDWDLSTIDGGSGDCGGNSGITFTTGANQYFYIASGGPVFSWSVSSRWYLGTGGSGGAGRVPLPQDTAIFDDLSFGATGMTITNDMPRIPTVTFKGVDGLHPVANTPTFTTSVTCSFFGDILLTPNMTLTASSQTYTYEGRRSSYLESAGNTWAKSFNINAPGGTLTLQDSLIQTGTANLTVTQGTFTNTSYNVSSYNMVLTIATGGTTTVNLGSATYSLSKTSGQVFGCNGSANLNAGSSTIKFIDTANGDVTFDGGGKTYNNVWFDRGASTGTITITGTNTFADLRDDGSVAHTIVMPNVTTNVRGFHISGSAGNLITLSRTGSSGTFTISKPSGFVNSDYLSISNCTVTGGATWFAGDHSVDGGNNTGWIWTSVPTVTTQKRFEFKAYDATGGFISTINDITDIPKFTSYINSGLGDMTFRLPRSISQYEEGTVVKINNQIKIRCFDADAPTGRTIYNGYISKYAPTLDQGKEYITVTCLGYITETERFMAEDASGNTTLTYNSYEPTDILKDILDKYTAAGGKIDYTGTSTEDTGTVVSYEMNTYTVKEALDKVIELAPNGWYYFVDADNVVNFASKDATANHTFVLGKDVVSIVPEKSSENVVNCIYFTGGDVSGATFFKKYTRASSVTAHGLHIQKYVDSRVTDETTADIIANAILDRSDTPETRTTLVIRDNGGEDGKGYDIESIKPGDTCKVLGYNDKSTNLWDVAIWDTDKWDYDITQVSSTVQQIMKVSYEPNKVTLEISSKLPNISHRVEDIKRNLDRLQTANNPSAPTT